jgi:tetratricopeptide (TPR) repeat protein
MRSPGLVALAIAVAAVAAALLYTTIAQEARYRRLMVEGENALASDQPFVAIEDFSGAIVLKPGSMSAYLQRGQAYRRRGDLQTALRDLRTATRLDPTAPTPFEDLGDVNFALERFARAAESYDSYLALDDRSATVLYKLALSLFRLGDPAMAARKLGQAVRLNDRFAEAFYLLGICQGQLGQTSAAIDSLTRALTLAPMRTGTPADQQRFSAAVREELIRFLLVMKRDSEAIRELEQLAALEPTRPDHLIDAGLIYGRLGRTDLAVAELTRAAEREPSQPRVYQALGRIWLESAETRHDRGYLNKALEALDRAARAADAPSETFTLRGRAQLLAGDASGAQQSFEQALRRTPVDPAAYRQTALLAERRGDLASARDSLLRYLALTTNDRDLRELPEQIGHLCLRLDDRAEAVRWLKQASEIGDDDATTIARVAELQLRAGDGASAASTVERGLRKTPGSAPLLALQRRLQSNNPAPPPRRQPS